MAESFKLFSVPLKSPVNIDDIFSFFSFSFSTHGLLTLFRDKLEDMEFVTIAREHKDDRRLDSSQSDGMIRIPPHPALFHTLEKTPVSRILHPVLIRFILSAGIFEK